jgi:hypothetical protein
MRRATALVAVTLALATGVAAQTPPATPPRLEIVHPRSGHDVHVSGAAIAADADGAPVVVWIAQEGDTNVLYAARPGDGGARIRVSPPDTSVDALHQAPGIATGPQGELYVSWSSRKPIPVGGLFASDLRLSRSLDGGRTWDTHLRINEDRPISHSFEGLAVAPDGTVLVGWIDSRTDNRAATYLARVVERGTRLAETQRLDTAETCVCCRVDVSAGPGETVAVLWRKVFPDNVRDMVVAVSRDGGRRFSAPALVHADHWKITACPHRGGALASDGRGRFYAVWYTEGTEGRPDLLFASSGDGRTFSAPRRLHTAPSSIPDHGRLAVDAAGRGVVVWEEATAVRRRVVMRTVLEGGRTLTPVRPLSQAIKAFAPDVIATPRGFMIVWHEEQFPTIKTVVQTLAIGGQPR